MKRKRSDSQIIFLTTDEIKQEIKKKALKLGLVTRSGAECMSDFIRMAIEYAINNYEVVTIVDYDTKELHYTVKRVNEDFGGICLLEPNPIKAILRDESIIGKQAIVDFVEEDMAICIDVLD